MRRAQEVQNEYIRKADGAAAVGGGTAASVAMAKEAANNGLMATSQTEEGRTSRFQMKALPTEVAQQVENMQVGDVSKAFEMINAKGQKVCAVIKLKSRIPGHRATLAEDYQLLKNIVLNKMREEKLHNWVVDKIKHTYVWMADRYKNCDFEHQGYVPK